MQGSYAQIVFSGTDSVNGFIQNVTYTVTANNGTVTIQHYEGRADDLPTVTASDNGKSLIVDNGEWKVGNPAIHLAAVLRDDGFLEIENLDLIPEAESEVFGNG